MGGNRLDITKISSQRASGLELDFLEESSQEGIKISGHGTRISSDSPSCGLSMDFLEDHRYDSPRTSDKLPLSGLDLDFLSSGVIDWLLDEHVIYPTGSYSLSQGIAHRHNINADIELRLTDIYFQLSQVVHQPSFFRSEALNSLRDNILLLETQLAVHDRTMVEKQRHIVDFLRFAQEYKATFALNDEQFFVEHYDELSRILVDLLWIYESRKLIGEYTEALSQAQHWLEVAGAGTLRETDDNARVNLRRIIAFSVKNLDDAHALVRYNPFILFVVAYVNEAFNEPKKYTESVIPDFEQRAA